MRTIFFVTVSLLTQNSQFFSDGEEHGDISNEEIRKMSLNVPVRSLDSMVNSVQRIKGIKKQDFLKKFEAFHTVPNLEEISAHFEKQIEHHRQQISNIEATREMCQIYAKAYWQSYRSEQALALRQTLVCSSRKRRQKLITKRQQHKCPIKNCAGRAVNIKRHFAHCHKHMTKEDVKNTLKVYDEMKKVAMIVETNGKPKEKSNLKKGNTYHRQCSICDKEVKRLDVHLVNTHLLKRRSKKYRDILNTSHRFCPEKEDEEVSIEGAAGPITVTVDDRKKNFLIDFELYLDKYTVLKNVTALKNVHIVSNFITECQEDEGPLTGQKMCDWVDKSVSPEGYFTRKGNVYSASYMRKIVIALKNVLEFMHKYTDQYHIGIEEYKNTGKILKAISVKWRKAEYRETYERRERKSRENISLKSIRKLIQSNYIQEVLDRAVQCLTNSSKLPVLVSQFIELRNVLITVLIVGSIRRVMEFTEFNLSEFHQRKLTKSEKSEKFVIRIAQHKTAEKGPALALLTAREEQALTSFVKNYRPIVSQCTESNCFVFTNSNAPSIGSCCSKLSFSNVAKCIRKVANDSGFNQKITSRILRRSQITALWDTNTDTAWRAKVAEQSSHSVETARRYYAYVDGVKPAMEVLHTLDSLRDTQDNSEKESDIDNPQAQEDQECMESPEHDREPSQSKTHPDQKTALASDSQGGSDVRNPQEKEEDDQQQQTSSCFKR